MLDPRRSLGETQWEPILDLCEIPIGLSPKFIFDLDLPLETCLSVSAGIVTLLAESVTQLPPPFL